MLLCRTTLPYKEPIKNIFSVCDTEEVADKFQKAFSLLGGEDVERVHMQSDRAESQVMGQGLVSREKFPLLSECALSECLLWINVPLKWHFRKYKSKYRSRLTDRYLTDCIGLAVCTYEPNYMALTDSVESHDFLWLGDDTQSWTTLTYVALTENCVSVVFHCPLTMWKASFSTVNLLYNWKIAHKNTSLSRDQNIWQGYCITKPLSGTTVNASHNDSAKWYPITLKCPSSLHWHPMWDGSERKD